MSVNLMFANRNTNQSSKTKADWAAIIAISASDAASPYPTEGYVAVDATVVVALAALLDGAPLANGTVVTTYDFSADYDGRPHVEAHINAFGPSLLDAATRATVRDALSAHPAAVTMFDAVIARGLQMSLSTDLLDGRRQVAHLKGMNWDADEVEINMSAGRMNQMLCDLGLGAYVRTKESVGELPFDRFVEAVNDNGPSFHSATGLGRLNSFIACARRGGATHVYWA